MDKEASSGYRLFYQFFWSVNTKTEDDPMLQLMKSRHAKPFEILGDGDANAGFEKMRAWKSQREKENDPADIYYTIWWKLPEQQKKQLEMELPSWVAEPIDDAVLNRFLPKRLLLLQSIVDKVESGWRVLPARPDDANPKFSCGFYKFDLGPSAINCAYADFSVEPGVFAPERQHELAPLVKTAIENPIRDSLPRL